MSTGKPQTPDVRRRALLIAVSVMLMTLIAVYSAFTDNIAGSWAALDLIRAAALLFLVLVLSTRSTTSFTMNRRDPVLDDELSRANRASAARYGFWSLMLGLLLSFVINLWIQVELTQAAPVLMALGAAGATLRFVVLEHAGDA